MNTPVPIFPNPFRPGAGHMPPYLAGRKTEEHEFRRLLKQSTVTENLILTGLRGIGKTVLLETFKPIAHQENWLWVGTDLSESASLTEETIGTRLLTDLSIVTSTFVIATSRKPRLGFSGKDDVQEQKLDYQYLHSLYVSTPGLVSDKLKGVLEFVWSKVKDSGKKGIVFAYDEAQNLADHAEHNQFPLSILLDVFQSVQRKNMTFMLLLTGLPTLFPKLVEARTYSERMFHVLFLKKLTEEESKAAITEPTKECSISFNEKSLELICQTSAGYPYFIQFICREAFDIWVLNSKVLIPIADITRKLDTDFFSGRWARVTDRQKELLKVIAQLDSAEDEFTVQDIVAMAKQKLEKPFSDSHVNQMLATLIKSGLIYKDRHGKYMFAVPLLAKFINRQVAVEEQT